ncbi:MAG: NAD(P)H-hydrate dehydratase [Anaerolineales bacterium]|nr:NAD(P)H-hydrate dehydratase [Anaerolineales bacterium]
MKVFSVAEMVAAEKAADAAGVSYTQMMETAGRCVAEAIIERVPVAGVGVLVLVGPGNNGGDGLVAGRYLAEAGANVAFYLTRSRDAATDENFSKIQEMGLFTLVTEFDQRFRVLRTRLNITDIVIDALLGTGVTRPIGGGLAKLMQQVNAGLTDRRAALAAQNRSRLTSIAEVNTKRQRDKETKEEEAKEPVPHLFIAAVDCPSGLNCDTGTLDPLALPADLTVTFAGPKRGHFIFPGAAACGELVVADIDISPDLPVVRDVPLELATRAWAWEHLPQRPLSGHKGTFGKVLIATGCEQYRGAPVLAAKGAFRAGAGLVGLAVPKVVRETAILHLPEATYPPTADDEMLSEHTAGLLLQTIDQYSAVLIGPGLGEADGFIDALFNAETIDRLPLLVVDADGLNILSRCEDWHKRLPPHTILTPHPAEMARLMRISMTEMKKRDRVETAMAQALAWGHIVLLKGAYTIVAHPDGKATILPFANPALAVGGSGDVLSGVILALLGQGVAPYEAAILGGYLHGAAGWFYPGKSGILAGEIADLIPTCITYFDHKREVPPEKWT